MNEEIRACRCTDFWAFHHPECPAMQTIRRLRAELAECRAGYAECISDLEDWASYASPYFQAKHDLAGDLAKHRAALAKGE